MTELPEDVIRFLRPIAVLGEIDHTPDSAVAQQLLAKYAPQPKTVADRFDIQWTRYIFEIPGEELIEASWPDGLTIDERGLAFDKSDVGELHVWPEVEGIDPRELLNNGWQIRRWLDVPQDWSFAFVSERGVEPSRMWRADIPATPNVIVFCRPPESDNQ